MTTTTTPTSGAADLPEALRSIQRFEVVDCIDDKHVPAVIPKPHGPWVRYEDHIAALAAWQATAQPAPENIRGILARCRDFIDTTKAPAYPAGVDLADEIDALLAAQAVVPADLITLRKPTTSAELLWLLKLAHLVLSYVDKTLEETFAPAQPAAQPSRFGSPELQDMIIARCVEKDQADSVPAGGYPPLPNLDSSDEPIWEAIFNWKTATTGADAVRKANNVENAIIETMRACVDADRAARAPADSVQEDAARWHWLAEYLVGTRTDLDDELVACETVNDLRKIVEAAIKQGEKK